MRHVPILEDWNNKSLGICTSKLLIKNKKDFALQSPLMRFRSIPKNLVG